MGSASTSSWIFAARNSGVTTGSASSLSTVDFASALFLAIIASIAAGEIVARSSLIASSLTISSRR